MGQQRLARAWLAFDQKRPFQSDGHVDHVFELGGDEVGLSGVELVETSSHLILHKARYQAYSPWAERARVLALRLVSIPIPIWDGKP